nr:FHA domain-containing protein [Tissierella sp.]
MYNILSVIFKYIFIIIIYMFIFSIIRLIYLDIKGISKLKYGDGAYLKLINKKESLPFKIDEDYVIEEKLCLGRKSDNDIVIKDPYVSKNHFNILKDEDYYFIQDLKSSNGTFLNGEKILDVSKLSNGDRIRIGNIEFLFVNREQV